MAQELKAYDFPVDHGDFTTTIELFYLKSEADKVIAELKKACNDKDDWCLHTFKENRHHKYKRCLAIVERCNDNIENQGQYDEHDDWLIITEYWERWRKRWLKLAEKFKEAK